jgi:hypothetical protein
MHHGGEILTRREFNGRAISTLGSLWLASQAGIPSDQALFEQETSYSLPQIASLERRRLSSSNEICGGVTNAAFVAYDSNPEIINRLVADMHTTGSNFLRLYPHPQLEDHTGNYNLEYISQLNDCISQVYSLSNGTIKAIVCIDDLYNLLHSMKFQPFYGNAELDHHSLNHAVLPEEIKERQKEFFTNPYWTQAYGRKVEVLYNAMKPVRHMVAAWEAFNEPEIPFETADKVGALTEFYDRGLNEIRKRDSDTPVVTGLANPLAINPWDLLKYNFINSAHVYRGQEQRGLDTYIDEMMSDPNLPPVILAECGIPSTIFNRKIPVWAHDILIANTISDMFIRNTRIDRNSNTAYMGISALGVWQIKTNKKSIDGFQYDTRTHRRTVEAMREVNSFLTFN